MFASLLFALQPAMAFGMSNSEAFVVNHHEDFSYFKTKSSKALVLHETSIQTVEISEIFQVNTGGFSAEILSLISEIENTYSLIYRLIDRRGLLTSQIFPFHFHF
jgi:hypothetical protein